LILEQNDPGPSFLASALRSRIASGRIFAIFPLPALYAMVCGLLLIFIVHYFYHARGYGRAFWVALFLLGSFNLVLTQSFGGVLFFTIGILFYLFASRIFQLKYLAPLLMVLTLMIFMVTATRFSEARELQPLKLRFANWLQAGRVIAAAPLLGVGLGNYETTVPAYVHPGEPASIYAHNFFLQAAAETGLPLFILLAFVCFFFIKKNLVGFLRPENALFASACVLILFFNFFDVGSYFIAAGISFAIASSQLFTFASARSWQRYLWPAVIFTGILLVNEAGADRQKAADLYLSRGEYDQADLYYRQSLRLNPYSYRALLGRAAIAHERHDDPRTEKALRRVLAIYPEYAYANYLYSQILFRKGAYLTTLAHAQKAVAANRGNAQYQEWHEFIKSNFKKQLETSGN
jgi:tetratricopeptide (TPR) repeat protein